MEVSLICCRNMPSTSNIIADIKKLKVLGVTFKKQKIKWLITLLFNFALSYLIYPNNSFCMCYWWKKLMRYFTFICILSLECGIYFTHIEQIRLEYGKN